jgi:hypothetical protein
MMAVLDTFQNPNNATHAMHAMRGTHETSVIGAQQTVLPE